MWLSWRALVVYESMYGDTRAVAISIAGQEGSGLIGCGAPATA